MYVSYILSFLFYVKTALYTHNFKATGKLQGEVEKKKKKPLCNQFKNSREEPSRKSNMKWLMVESYRLLNLVP